MRILLTWLLLLVPLAAQEKPAQEAKPEEAKKEEAPPATAAESDRKLTINLDFGYRARTDIRGNSNAYRSVVNLGEGPKLFLLDLSLENAASKMYDRIDLRASGWGGDPYNTARLDAKKSGLYRLSVDYRNIAYYNFLPSFADPTAASGIFLNQRSYDVKRRLSNVELDILPGKRFVPYVAWTHDSGSGRGITDFVSDGNEYPVAGTLSDRTDRYRGGVRMEFSKWHATIEQGGGKFSQSDEYITGVNPGNRTTPVFGQTLSLKSLRQAYDITGNHIYSKGLFTANPFSWLDFNGQFLYTQPDTKTNYTLTDSGQLIILSNLLFYNGQQGLTTADAKLPHSTGSLGAEVRPFSRLRIIESWMTDRLHNASSAFFTEQILLSGNQSQNILNPAAFDRAVWNYSEQRLDALFDVTKRLTLRGGHRYVYGDAQVRPSPIFPVAGGELGELRRHSGIAGLNYRVSQKLSTNFEFEGASGDKTYFRTSLQDYKKTKLRARFQPFQSLSFQGQFSMLDNENPSPTIKYNLETRATTLTTQWMPAAAKRISLLGEYSRTSLHSEIGYFVPQTMTPALSLYRENAHSFSSLLDLSCFHNVKLSAGGTGFIAAGSRPTEFYQPMMRLLVPMNPHWAWRAEWQWHSLAERYYRYESFGAHTFVIALQLH